MTTMATSEELRVLHAELAAVRARLGELENTIMVLLRDHKQPKEKADL
jgi:hypothetical protein